MITTIYRGIALVLLVLVARSMFRERDFWKQATGALVLVPLVLRILLVK